MWCIVWSGKIIFKRCKIIFLMKIWTSIMALWIALASSMYTDTLVIAFWKQKLSAVLKLLLLLHGLPQRPPSTQLHFPALLDQAWPASGKATLSTREARMPPPSWLRVYIPVGQAIVFLRVLPCYNRNLMTRVIYARRWPRGARNTSQFSWPTALAICWPHWCIKATAGRKLA